MSDPRFQAFIKRRREESEEETGEGPDQFPGEPPIPLDRADLLLVRKASKDRWPIPEAGRRLLMAKILSAVKSGLCTPRTLISAAKTFAALDKLNMEQERRDDPSIKERHEIELKSDDLREAAAELNQWRSMMAGNLSSLPSAAPTQPTSPTPTS